MRSGIVLLIPIALLAGLIPQVLAAPSAAPLLVQAPTRQEPKVSGRGLKFETYTDAKGEYRWRLKSSNGQVIATSGQGYKDKRDRANAIQRIRKDARSLKFEQYADASGGLRWRLKSSNGQVIATSGQGYKDKRDCENAIDVIKRGAQGAKVEESKSAEGS
jgi:uncharacterized protein YegP (UPF0339 family)